MSTLDDFMAFNFCEDEREQQANSKGSWTGATTEYPYQKQYWESDDDSKSSKYWDDDSSKDDDY